MVPYDHAILSVRDFGGDIEDYLPIHKFLDQSKFQFTDFRHRAILHNPMGISLCEQVFGDIVRVDDFRAIPVREIARRHIMQDCSQVPTTKEWIEAIADGTVSKFNNPSPRDLKYLEQWRKEQQEIQLRDSSKNLMK